MAVAYELVTRRRAGKERVHRYASDDGLRPGDVVRLDGRDWLIETIEDARAVAKPARYRLRLVHPDGHEELGAFRRYRPGSPGVGHSFATTRSGRTVSWAVGGARLAHDDEGEPYLDLVAERDYGESEAELPNHELEHALAAREAELPEGTIATLARARAAGLSVELVALEPGEEPDWQASSDYIDHVVLDMVEDDLLELCGVDPDNDPRDTWLATVQERLHADLERFRADVEGSHDEIEEWDYLDGRVFASVGSAADEANPDSGHGWMCRLLDASPLVTAGFARVRRPEL